MRRIGLPVLAKFTLNPLLKACASSSGIPDINDKKVPDIQKTLQAILKLSKPSSDESPSLQNLTTRLHNIANQKVQQTIRGITNFLSFIAHKGRDLGVSQDLLDKASALKNNLTTHSRFAPEDSYQNSNHFV
jgi:hypothetical protein